MAENKKSFLLYCDLIHTVKKMPKEKAGELFVHILEYVNDENPITEDLIINLTFEPVKQSLKRDLIKYKNSKEEKRNAGRLGNLKRWNTDLYDKVLTKEITLEEAENIAFNRKTSQSDSYLSQSIAKIAVSDSVNVSDSGIFIVSEKDFLEMFNKCRKHFDKLETNIDSLKPDEKKEFALTYKFDKKYFENALTGFYKQKNIFAQLRIRPLHFLKNIELYNECYFSKKQLYHEPNNSKL